MTINRQAADRAFIAGRKNLLINGGFDVWQRGTSFAISGFAYTADRWPSSAGNGAATVSRQAFSLGQGDVPWEPKYFLRHDRTTASTVLGSPIYQRLEDVRTLAGQKATFSFNAKAAAAKDFIVRAVQVFGSGAGASASVATTLASVSIGTTWQRHTVTADIPSISGKTIDGADSFLQIDITEAANFSTFTLDLANAQLEAGEVATPFEHRPIGEELALCQRYFAKTRGDGQFYADAAARDASYPVIWLVTMRDTPSVSITGTGIVGNLAAGWPKIFNITAVGTRMQIQSSAAGTTYALNVPIDADAEL